MRTYNYGDFAEASLLEILGQIPEAKVALIGDVCLDIYWFADMKRSELSRETPHFPLPIVEEHISLGGAGNVAANFRSLGVSKLTLLSVIGDDWRGRIMKQLLEAKHIDDSRVFEIPGIFTPTYVKPIRTGISDVRYEDPRLDFTNYQPYPESIESKLLEQLDLLPGKIDVLAVSDQFEFSCITPKIREKISELGKKITVIIDSRKNAQLYRNVIVKPNEVEAAAIVGRKIGLESLSTDGAEGVEGAIGAEEVDGVEGTNGAEGVDGVEGTADLERAASTIRQITGRPLIITLGEKGSYYSSDSESFLCEAFPVTPPVDFVGAGDTFLAAFAAATACKTPPQAAMLFANLASAVTIKEIGTTGEATPGAMVNAYRNGL